MAKEQKIQSTQKYLDILVIKEGIIILKDGGLRSILKVSSLNFALKSEEEQSGLINQYQGFLNALKFDIQIVMQSRRLDLYNYMRYLKEVAQQQTNEMVKIQTEDYINYIERLLTKANIMDKRFYVVIPFFPTGVQQKGWIDKILGGSKTTIQFSAEQFKSHKEQLLERANIVTQGLGGMGLKVTPLATQEIIELLYGIYNPEEAMSERLVEAGGLSAPVIGRADEAPGEAGEGQKAKDDDKKTEKQEEQTGAGEQKQEPGTTGEAPGVLAGQEKKVDNITQPSNSNQQIPLGAEIKIGGQNFFPTPQSIQTMSVAPGAEAGATPGAGVTPTGTAAPAAPGVPAPAAQSAPAAQGVLTKKEEPMTKERADAILGKVLDTNMRQDQSAGATLWGKEGEAQKQEAKTTAGTTTAATANTQATANNPPSPPANNTA